jgi:hypothetical protein
MPFPSVVVRTLVRLGTITCPEMMENDKYFSSAFTFFEPAFFCVGCCSMMLSCVDKKIYIESDNRFYLAIMTERFLSKDTLDNAISAVNTALKKPDMRASQPWMRLVVNMLDNTNITELRDIATALHNDNFSKTYDDENR